MTVQLDTRATVTVDASAAVKPLQDTAAASRGVGEAMRKAATEAQAAGVGISQSVRAVTREVEEANRQQVVSAQAAVSGKRGVERKAALERLEEVRRVAREEVNQARAAAAVVVAEARRKAEAERLASDQIRKAQVANRLGMAQLGMQMNDVATQLASGTSAAVVFAQQANQVGFAMSMMGGTFGRVGAILGGPWGAAITAAVMGLSLLISRSDEAGDSGESMAERYGEAGAEIEMALEGISGAFDELGAVLDAAGEKVGSWAVTIGGKLAEGFNEIADFVGRTNGLIPRAIDKLVLAGTPAGDDIQLLNPSQLEAQRQAQARALAGRQMDRRLAQSQGNGLFLDDGFTRFDPFKGDSLRDTGRAFSRAADEAEREAKRAADAAEREATRAADAAAREAKRFAEEQAKLLNDLARMARETVAELNELARGDGSYVGFLGRLQGAEQARADANTRSRDATGLSAAVAQAETNIDYRRAQDEAAREARAARNASIYDRAQSIGSALGGTRGGQIGSIAGALFTGDSQQLAGLRGPAGDVARSFAPALQSREFKEAFRDVVNQLEKVFGDMPMAKQLGSALEAAGIGASVGGLVGNGSMESQIGGAVGGVVGKEVGKALGESIGGLAGQLGGPLGTIVGGMLGSVLGGLLSKPKTGSVTITGGGGEVNQAAAVGNGGMQVQNVSILGNNFTNSLNQIVERLGATVGTFAVSIGQSGNYFRVDTTGQGRTNKKLAGVQAFGEDADAAIQAALADAIRDGAVAGVSPRVQAVLKQYATNLDRGVAEALKVQNLENLLEDRLNPLLAPFRDFERQAAERLRIAKAYGFDVVEIERVNAEERAKLIEQAMEEATSSAKALLDDLRFGSRAEGSASERLAALSAERSRLEGLVAGGDTGQIDALTQVIQQQIDLSREAYGSTGQFATDRAGAIAALETLIRQTEERVNAAATAAQSPTVDQLTELNSTADEQMTELQRQTALLQQIMSGAQGGGFSGIIQAFARMNV